jgi:hypothetical protein
VHTEGRPTLRPGLTLQLPPSALYNYAGYTRPAFRGLGLQAWRHRALLDHPAWTGFDTVWGYVRATNFASQRGQARSGYRRVGTLWLVGQPKRFRVWISPSLRALGLRQVEPDSRPGAGRGSRPEMRLEMQPDPRLDPWQDIGHDPRSTSRRGRTLPEAARASTLRCARADP